MALRRRQAQRPDECFVPVVPGAESAMWSSSWRPTLAAEVGVE